MLKQNKILISLMSGLFSIALFAGSNIQQTFAVSPAMVTPVPHSCDATLFHVISGQMKKLDFATGTYTQLGDYSGFDQINAMGYNVNDNFIYSLARQEAVDVNGVPVSVRDIVKIDANGDVFYHVSPTDFIRNSVVGEVVDNKLWIAANTDIYKIDLATGAVEQQTADADMDIVDWGYINGKFYGARGDVLFTIDPSTNPASVTTTTVPGLLPGAGGYGATYVFDTDELFVSKNSGGLYQIFGYDTPSPTAIYVSNSEPTSTNDGASCPIAEFIPPAGECTVVDSDTDGDDVLDSIDIDNDNDGILDQNESGDTDGDGVINMCDLDSDNDGISDLVESGTSSGNQRADTNGDGFVSSTEAGIAIGGVADRDVDGLMDIFDSNTGNVNPGASVGTNPANNDGTDEPDFLDLDSDNDGIPDAIEAQPTNGYAGTFGTDNNVTDDDADGDGVIGIYDSLNGVFGGSFTTPQNTDSVDSPDYIDLDSDNDTKPDV